MEPRVAGVLLVAVSACANEHNGGAARDAGALDASANADASVPAVRCRHFTAERQPFFGDLHVHTALSLDANLEGTRLRPVDAYRFARGETVDVPPYDAAGKPARTLALERPLDFVAVSDHAEYLGLVTTCLTPGLPGYDSTVCADFRAMPEVAFYALNATGVSRDQGNARPLEPCNAANAYCESAALLAWNELKEAARGAQDSTDSCGFSAFVAYEWSASPGTKNLHRNVIFATDQVPRLPFSYFEGNQEEELWDALERDCLQTSGCDVLTIPHNSNLSAGLMFEPVDRQGRPFDRRYAERRARFEPLVEIFQHKGSSECLPEMGPDELCKFENMPFNTLSSATLGGAVLGGRPDQLLPADYVRDALGKGLALARTLGVNPYAYGFVASTDTHFGLAGGVDERTFSGHGGAGANARFAQPLGLPDNVWFNPGGLAVLWAEENSRSALFSAMKRREAYATSGPRIVLRLFGGFGLPDDLCGEADFAARGYASGVPMGGALTRSAQAGAPRFAISALRDPGTASAPGLPLQRAQIIKGWLEGDRVAYAVYDVAGAPNDASVDLTTCAPRGTGADELCGVWRDPAFDPTQPAFYYARVLENPSCRWHTRACRAAGVDCDRPETKRPGFEGCCLDYPATDQERAWSSPIFYEPG